MKKTVGTNTTGYATVTLDADRIITCTLHGFISEKIATESVAQTGKLVQQLGAMQRPVLLFIDATGVTGQDSGARSAAKALGSQNLARVAICNRSVTLGVVIQYLVRAAGIGGVTRVMHSKAHAMRWLLEQEMPAPYAALRRWFGLFVVLLPCLALLGWGLHNQALTAVVPGRKPLNPEEALCLVLLGLALLLIKRHEQLSKARRSTLIAIAAVVAFFGLAVLLQYGLNRSMHIDTLLFHGSLFSWQYSGLASLRSSFLLTMVGIMLLALLSGQRHRWQQYAFHVASLFVFVVALATTLGYGFHAGGEYLVPQLPMSVNAALCFIMLCVGLQPVARPLPLFDKMWRWLTTYSQAVSVMLMIVIITGVAWQQANESRRSASLEAAREQFSHTKLLVTDRLNGYINALGGFRSFFQSSDFVEAHEFTTYFNSSNLATQYPGFSAITFARSVPVAQRASFIASLKQQASSSYPALASAAIFPATNLPVAYPITYVEPRSSTTKYGFDLASDPTRRAALETARDKNKITATGTIDLNASQTNNSLSKRAGFFITIPVYKGAELPPEGAPTSLAQRQATIYGFVNAVFEDSKLFGDIFHDYPQKGVSLVIQNLATDEVLYAYNPHAANLEQEAAYSGNIDVAGQVWRLQLYAPPNFGVGRIDRLLPPVILASGLTLAAVASFLVAGQSRRKEQALVLATNMTEDLNNERNLAVLLRKKDEAVLSSIGDAVFAIDPFGKIILFNPVAERLTGQAAHDAIGKHFTESLDFFNEKDRKPANGFIDTALAGKKSEMAQNTVLRRKDGSEVPVADSAAPIITSGGQVEGVVVVFRDVRRERELMKLKDDFVSIASHELRTPMGAVRAFVSMILAGDYGPVNDNLVEPLNDIKNSTMRLVNLVNDLLDAARIEAGRMKFAIQEVEMAAVVKEVASSLAPLGHEKGIVVSAEATTTVQVQTDPDKLKQILTNLVGNALKFTDKGSITLKLEVQPNVAQVSVADTGMGISKEDQQVLFGKFQQITSAQAGRPAGTGLGLYISREIARKMGGDMWLAESASGKGSIFVVALPRSGTVEARQAKENLDREAGLHPDQK